VPLVLVVMMLVAVMAASVQQVAWRSLRAAESRWRTQHAQYAAESELVRWSASWASSWAAESAALVPIGTRREQTRTEADGWRIQRSVVRTGVLSMVAVARAERGASSDTRTADVSGGRLRDATLIRRTVWRAFWLEPPPLPILGAGTILGDVSGNASGLSGRDIAEPRVAVAADGAGDECGPLRDTLSLPALVASSIDRATVPAPDTRTLAPLTADSARQTFDAAWSAMLARAGAGSLNGVGAVSPMAPWHAVVLRGATGVTIAAPSRVVGLLMIEGDLLLRAPLRVDGLLVVRGAVRSPDAALEVRGALVVRDAARRGTVLGEGTVVRYAPCMAGRALVAVALSRNAPFRVWNSP
jgi:hypothetical protein